MFISESYHQLQAITSNQYQLKPLALPYRPEAERQSTLPHSIS
jgi:hypothetical protein